MATEAAFLLQVSSLGGAMQTLAVWLASADFQLVTLVFTVATFASSIIVPVLVDAVSPGRWTEELRRRYLEEADKRAQAMLAVIDRARRLGGYRKRLFSILQWLERQQGAQTGLAPHRPFRLFLWCLGVAYAYAIAGFFLTVLVGGDLNFEATASPPAPWWTRLLFVCTALTTAAVMYGVLRFGDAIDAGFRAWWAQRRWLGTARTVERLLGGVVGAGIGIGLIALGDMPPLNAALFGIGIALFASGSLSTAIVAVAAVGAVASAAVFQAAGAVAAAAGLAAPAVAAAAVGAVAAVRAAVGAVAAVTVVIGISWVAGGLAVQAYLGHGWPTPEFTLDPRWAGTLSIVWFASPLLNAATDALSWIVSRWLAAHVLRALARPEDQGFGLVAWIVIHLVIDIVVAVLLLLLTAFLIGGAFDLWNAYLAWLGYGADNMLVLDLAAIVERPLTDGLWFWLMLLTTLVPTIVHLGLLFASLFGFRQLTSSGLRAAIAAVTAGKREVLSRAAAGDREAFADVPPFADAGDARKLARFEAKTRPAATISGMMLALSLTSFTLFVWNSGLLPSLSYLVVEVQEGEQRAREILPHDHRRWWRDDQIDVRCETCR